jgi:hypothetical protein
MKENSRGSLCGLFFLPEKVSGQGGILFGRHRQNFKLICAERTLHVELAYKIITKIFRGRLQRAGAPRAMSRDGPTYLGTLPARVCCYTGSTCYSELTMNTSAGKSALSLDPNVSIRRSYVHLSSEFCLHGASHDP